MTQGMLAAFLDAERFLKQSLAGSGSCREDLKDRSRARDAFILAAKGADFEGRLSHPSQHHTYQGLVMSASSDRKWAGRGRPWGVSRPWLCADATGSLKLRSLWK